jgi:hypothetical protein
MTSVKPVNIEPIRFEWPTLRYYYFTTPIVREGESGESDDSEGLGRMMFTSHGEAPKRFEGIYSYGGLHGRAVVKGRRATAEEIKDLHQSDRGPALIRKLVLEFHRISGTSDRSVTVRNDGPSHPASGSRYRYRYRDQELCTHVNHILISFLSLSMIALFRRCMYWYWSKINVPPVFHSYGTALSSR